MCLLGEGGLDGKGAGGVPAPAAASGRSKALWQSGVASPLHRLAEQHDDLLLHVVLPGGLHGHHGRDVAADIAREVSAAPTTHMSPPKRATSQMKVKCASDVHSFQCDRLCLKSGSSQGRAWSRASWAWTPSPAPPGPACPEPGTARFVTSLPRHWPS